MPTDDISLTNSPEQEQLLTETHGRIAILPEGGWMVQVQMSAQKNGKKLAIAEAGFHFINLEIGEQFVEQARKTALNAIGTQKGNGSRIILPNDTSKGASRIVKP